MYYLLISLYIFVSISILRKMSLKSGHRIVPVIGQEAQKQIDDFYGNRFGTLRLQPDGWFFTLPFIHFADKIFDFKFKPNDVVIMTFPKCGTTWTQEIVWTILNNPNLDHPKAALPINGRCPFLEFDFLLNALPETALAPENPFYDMFVQRYPERNATDGVFLQMAELKREPRIIKTHLPLSLMIPSLLDTCKVIYVARNPLDVAVSFCHHSRLYRDIGYEGNISGFVDHLVNDTLLYSPFWQHQKEAWRKREHPNLLYCFYENMKADTKAEISRITNFLGAKLSDDQIDNVLNHTSFESMKSREDEFGIPVTKEFYNLEVLEKDGGFFRKGTAGDWKTELSSEDIEKIDKWTEKNSKINDALMDINKCKL